MPDIFAQPYVRLTTFTSDGRAKHTPVWIVGFDDNLAGTTTDDDSWKVKRIRNTSKIELAPSDGKGRVADGAATLSGSARIIDRADAHYGRLESAFIKKYGWQYRLFRFIRKVRGKTPCGIAVTLD